MSDNASLWLVTYILLIALVGTIAIGWKATEMADSYSKKTRKKGFLILVFLDIVLIGILICLVSAK